MLALAPSPSQPPRPIPYGLVSLWDMINFSLYSFVWAMKLLEQEAAIANLKAVDDEYGPIEEADLQRFRKILTNGIAPPLTAMFIAEGRLGRLASIARLGGAYGDLAHELHALRSDIVDATEFERFYHYPRDKGLLVLRTSGDWATTLKAFPASREDVEAAVDCYALGRDRASIHHAMMVLEDGLVALATKIKVKFKLDRTTWAPLIDDIRSAINNELDNLAKSPKGTKPKKGTRARKELLEGCQEAALDLRHFKNVWRDHIAHNRGDYDDNDARKVLDHVRSFMEIVSTKLKLKQIS